MRWFEGFLKANLVIQLFHTVLFSNQNYPPPGAVNAHCTDGREATVHQVIHST